MKISDQEVSRLLSYSLAERRGNTSTIERPSSAPFTSRPAAGVRISATAQDIQRVLRAIDQLPDVRADRVQELKTQIDAGSYNVSGANIADLIIRRALADYTSI